MHKKHHKKFKILDILAVTTQAREGIETLNRDREQRRASVTTQAREGIETLARRSVQWYLVGNNSSP